MIRTIRSGVDKEVGVVARILLVLFLAAYATLVLATPAHAAITLTKDGLESAQIADCVIDVDSLQRFTFSTTNDNFQLKKTAGTYQEKNNDTVHTIYGIYYWNTPRAGETSVPGAFELVWDDALLDAAGTRHDLHAKFSNIRIKWSRNPDVGEVSQQLLAISSTSMRIMAEPGGLVRWDSASGTYKSVYDAWERTTVNALGVSCDVTFWNGDATSLLYNLYARDIDQPDRFTGNELSACTFGGTWAESFTPSSSFSTFHVQRNTWLAVDGNRIYGTKNDDDEEQNRTAFVSAGTMRGSSTPLGFSWKGSMCSTRILQDWSYTLKTRVIGGIGGSITTNTHDVTFIKSTTESTWNSTTTVPRNSYVVTAEPAEGYHITGMWLDGAMVSDDEIAAGVVHVQNVNANHTVSVKYAKDAPQTGYAQVIKTSAESAITDDNSCYSLEGARYGIYSDQECDDLLGTLVTDAYGTSQSFEIEAGSYYIREDAAPLGYILDDEVFPLEVLPGESTVIRLTETPRAQSIDVIVQKVDAKTGLNHPQGAASLAGAQFTIDFYAGDHAANSLPPTPTRSWVMQTDASGCVKLTDQYKVSGDDFYLLDGAVVMPLGTVSVMETKAPEGYLLTQEEPLVMRVTLNQDGTDVTGIPTPTIEQPTLGDEVILGGVRVKKTSSSDDEPLQGAVFAVRNGNEESITVAGTSYEPGSVCLTIQTQENGIASSEGRALPYGHYTIEEQQAPSGYRLDETWSKDFDVVEDGVVVDLTGEPARNERIALSVPLEATKTFDGANQGMALEADMFSFELCTQDGRVLQTKGNDAQGKITFDALGFDYDDLEREHVYTIREVSGSDERITYDTHIETVRIELSTHDDGSLAATVTTDDDGLVFHNMTVPDTDLPVTGQRGAVWAEAGALITLAIIVMTMRRNRRRIGRS